MQRYIQRILAAIESGVRSLRQNPRAAVLTGAIPLALYLAVGVLSDLSGIAVVAQAPKEQQQQMMQMLLQDVGVELWLFALAAILLMLYQSTLFLQWSVGASKKDTLTKAVFDPIAFVRQPIARGMVVMAQFALMAVAAMVVLVVVVSALASTSHAAGFVGLILMIAAIIALMWAGMRATFLVVMACHKPKLSLRELWALPVPFWDVVGLMVTWSLLGQLFQVGAGLIAVAGLSYVALLLHTLISTVMLQVFSAALGSWINTPAKR